MKHNLKEYQKKELSFFEDLVSILGEQLLFYCLVGSLGRGKVIPYWSDMDVLIVISSYQKTILKKVELIIQKHSHAIKIGVTLYTPDELTRVGFADPKTLHYLESIVRHEYKPRVHSPRVHIPIPQKQQMELFDLVDFSKHLHSLKRELLLGELYDEKKTYKIIITLIKILLRRKHVKSVGYTDVLKKTDKYLAKFNFDTPEYIVKRPNERMVRHDRYRTFLNWISTHALHDMNAE